MALQHRGRIWSGPAPGGQGPGPSTYRRLAIRLSWQAQRLSVRQSCLYINILWKRIANRQSCARVPVFEKWGRSHLYRQTAIHTRDRRYKNFSMAAQFRMANGQRMAGAFSLDTIYCPRILICRFGEKCAVPHLSCNLILLAKCLDSLKWAARILFAVWNIISFTEYSGKAFQYR